MATKVSSNAKNEAPNKVWSNGKQVYFGRCPQATIKVSENVIDSSIQKSSGHCMVAEAIKERYPNVKFVAVDVQTIRFSDPEKEERYTYLTPRAVQVAIVKFDQGLKPDPFSFRLKGAQVTRAGNTAQHNAKNRERQAKVRETKRVEEKAFLRKVVGGAGNGTSIPEKVGGRPPPHSVGKRRQFGLRSFDI